MLQSLLEERLRLTTHQESREFSGYELLVAPSGSKLNPTTVTGSLGPPPETPYKVVGDKDGYPSLPRGVRQSALVRNGSTFARFRDYSLPELAQWLGPKLGTTVPNAFGVDGGNLAPARIVDKTGLSGNYDFTLEYEGIFTAMESLPPAMQDRLESSSPSIFVALEKQLGLKLQKSKIPTNVIVIDHIEKAPLED